MAKDEYEYPRCLCGHQFNWHFQGAGTCFFPGGAWAPKECPCVKLIKDNGWNSLVNVVKRGNR